MFSLESIGAYPDSYPNHEVDVKVAGEEAKTRKLDIADSVQNSAVERKDICSGKNQPFLDRRQSLSHVVEGDWGGEFNYIVEKRSNEIFWKRWWVGALYYRFQDLFVSVRSVFVNLSKIVLVCSGYFVCINVETDIQLAGLLRPS